MFTGIIEEVGVVASIKRKGDIHTMQIRCSFTPELKLGESIAVNGSCLTVTSTTKDSFQVEIVEETYKRTNFRYLNPGDRVNLERSLRVDSRLNGHIVTGHVDGVGEVVRIEDRAQSAIFYIRCPENLKWFLAEKGSVAIDGISLTIAEVNDSIIKIAVIPHTLENTNLRFKKVSSKVNIEVDIIARYLSRLLERKQSSESLRDFIEGR